MSAPSLHRGLAVVACLVLAWPGLLGCDHCAGMEAEVMATCCAEHDESPSCVTVPNVEECASDNDDSAGACTLPTDAELIGRLDVDADSDVFSLVAPESSQHAELGVEVRAGADGGSTSAAIDVAVTNEAGDVVDSFVVTGARRAERSFGVNPGAVYFVRLASTTANGDASMEYRLRLTFGTESFEREPNGDAARATSVGEGSLRGVASAVAIDVDYFRTAPNAGATRMTVSLMLTEAVGPVDLEGAVLDGREAVVGTLLAKPGEPGVAVIGVSDEVDYLVRVGGRELETEIAYELAVAFDQKLVELEPNDTMPNAQQVPVGVEIAGAYSQVPPLVDDDIYRVTGALPDTTVLVTLQRTDPVGTSEVMLDVLDAEALVTESIGVGPGAAETLEIPVAGQDLLLRIRLDERAADATYVLSVASSR